MRKNSKEVSAQFFVEIFSFRSEDKKKLAEKRVF